MILMSENVKVFMCVSAGAHLPWHTREGQRKSSGISTVFCLETKSFIVYHCTYHTSHKPFDFPAFHSTSGVLDYRHLQDTIPSIFQFLGFKFRASCITHCSISLAFSLVILLVFSQPHVCFLSQPFFFSFVKTVYN